jgi:predicted nuclease of restriction endonuclease-like (RecB) superfamily
MAKQRPSKATKSSKHIRASRQTGIVQAPAQFATTQAATDATAVSQHKAPPTNYDELFALIRTKILESNGRAALAVNHTLVVMNWELGQHILGAQRQEGWGAGVIDRLSADLTLAFPNVHGFSPRNLKYMRGFALAYPDPAIVQALAQISWYHNITLLDKLSDTDRRVWYAQQAFKHGWSRNVLVHQIESDLYRRQGGRPVTNFERTLPPPQSDLVRQLVKDPYNLEFLTLGAEASERELELGLIGRLKDFLLELGVGFAFIGNQYRLEVAGEEFFLDLLFYHVHLHCYVVIELKIEDFKPEFAGKLNFYLSAVDDQLRHPGTDGPTIGVLLCKGKNDVVVEYALRDTTKPMGVSTYRLGRSLPRSVREALPGEAQLRAELEKLANDQNLRITVEPENIRPPQASKRPGIKKPNPKPRRKGGGDAK